MASVSEEMSFQFFVLIKVHLNSPMWLVSAASDRAGLRDDFPDCEQWRPLHLKGRESYSPFHREFRVNCCGHSG